MMLILRAIVSAARRDFARRALGPSGLRSVSEQALQTHTRMHIHADVYFGIVYVIGTLCYAF